MIFGVAALYAAVRSALAIWLPKYRFYWGGPFTGHSSEDDPKRLQCGTVSCAGCSLMWVGLAAGGGLSLFSDSTRHSHIGLLPGIFVSCILAGFIVMMVGRLLDSRARKLINKNFDSAQRGSPTPLI